MSTRALDVATVRAALDLLRGEPRDDAGRGVDLDITALGTLVEAICFSEAIQIPDLGHHRGAELAAEAGEIVQFVPLSSEQRGILTADARFWLQRHCDPDGLAQLFGILPTVGDVSWGSHGFHLLEAVGVQGKEVPGITEALRRDSGTSLWSYAEENPVDPDAGPPTQRYERRGGQRYGRRTGGGGDRGTPLKWAIAGLLGPHQGGETYARHWIVDPKTQLMVKSLVWTLLRTRSYLLWAREFGVTYMPHPVRARMAGFAAAVEDQPDEFVHHMDRQDFIQQYLKCLGSVHEEGLEAAAEIGLVNLIRFPFPTVLPYVIERARSRETVLEAAYDLRDTRGAKSFRSRVSDLEDQVAGGDLAAAVKVRNDLDRVSLSLRRDLGLVAQPSIATSLSIGPSGVSLNLAGPSVPLPSGADKALDRLQRPWLVLLRDIFDAMSSAASLGRLYDVLYPPRRGNF